MGIPERSNVTLFSAMTGWNASAIQLGTLAAEANSVVMYRMLGMAGLWSMPPSEMMRMSAEKGPAFIEGFVNATEAAGAGKPMDEVVTAFAEPLERTARSNRHRLERRGPKLTMGIESED
ncbi:antifreeze protein [Salipiger sp.]|uniref:antifreeze protein n=1 Tax=Salipiger sp. TaxID=2078585 RepID=UPI003A988327